ncbi:MAG: HAD-IB family phosphatase [Asticcacaulis sp.]
MRSDLSSAPVSLHAFDFDGTLTYKDSFTAYLVWEKGYAALASAFLRHPYMLTDYLKTKDRGALKSHLLFHLMGPIERKDLETRFETFVTATGHSLFRPDAMDKWQSLADSKRVIVTASPALLVGKFGHLIGANLTIGTELGFDADDRLTLDLASPNCRGAEKVTRLKATFGEDVVIESAFGDTSGDFEMLKAAREGHYRLFKAKP